MNIEREFLVGKKSALSKLEKAKKENKVDIGIMPILDIINNSDDYFTSSSCYGRIVLLEIPNIGNKKEAIFLGKWHSTINIDELFLASNNSKKGQIWLLSQSPIIHITSKTTNAADRILKLAIACGFKNSGLKSIKKRIVVEICSTERLDVPIGKDGNLYCNKEHLDLLTNISNEIFNKSTNKLKKFEMALKKDLSTHKSTEN
jgi:tRNA wybutosine-synthesizing protein 3